MKKLVVIVVTAIVMIACVGRGRVHALQAQQASQMPQVQAPSSAAYVPPAARSQDFELSIRSIMRAEALVGQAPSGIRFSDDSEWIYFSWIAGGGPWDADPEQYRVRTDGGEPERVQDGGDDDAFTLAGGDLSPDGRERVLTVGGDIWIVDRNSGERRQITDTQAGENGAFFGPDGERIFYQTAGNLFSIGVDGTMIRQITDIRNEQAAGGRGGGAGRGGRGGGAQLDPQQRFLHDQQQELFAYLRRQAEAERRDSIADAQAEAANEDTDAPQPIFAPPGQRLGGFSPSPDGSHIIISTFETGAETENTTIPYWITESGYTEARNGRSKVGDDQTASGVGYAPTATGEVTWLRAAPDGYTGEVRTSAGDWNDAGTYALVTTRSLDNKDVWRYSVRATDGAMTLLDHIHDDAWVAGPCGGCSGWVPGTERAYFVTEATGYAHLYTIAPDGTDRRALTSGDWELLDLEVNEAVGRFLVTTNEGSPFNQHVGWLDFDGGPIDYMTSGDGSYDVTVSPDGEHLAFIHSVANRPPELYVADADDPMDMQQVTLSPTAEWLSFPWLRPEIIRFSAEDGTSVPARIYRPSDLGAQANGAAVIFVHGAGYLHNVHNFWSSYYREYMFNHFLAANGYTVLDIDYRGSAGYGRDWRTAIYRWMGGKDLSDQVDGARWLVANEGVDAERIGLYGGSYGGFITLMGLFTAGETFKSGAALRSVTDWAHYNHGYTSNILNQPQDDEEAYRQSSPIYFAENFGPDQYLVMLHGMVDTNVHFSDIVRLTQRLIELGKTNWELAVYPVESHGFTEPTSWTDEYRRIFELFERTLSRPGCTDNGGMCPIPTGGG